MKRWVFILLLGIFVGFAAFAGYKLFSGLLNYKKGNDLYDGIKKSAVTEKSTEATAASTPDDTTEGSSGAPARDYSAYEHEEKLHHLHADIDYMIWPAYDIDFDMLKDLTEDIVGWIRIDGTHVDYPVVQHSDNDFYIRHGIDGQPLNTGSIFVDYRDSAPFEKDNTIIYGHNQRNSAMFHDLTLYRDADFAKAHPFVIIYLPDGTELTYRVFSAYETPIVTNTYSLTFSGADAYYSYLLEMQSKSEVDLGVTLSPEDRIITLSTCTNSFDENYRIVVQAKLIATR